MSIPDDIRQTLRSKLWARADELGWQALTWVEKSPWYEAWCRDPDVGGVLSRYMDQRQVRVYIKDTIIKGYVRSRQASPARPFRILGIPSDAAIQETWERPHGRRLHDGRVVAWGNAEDWKLVLTAIFERSWRSPGTQPFGAVLFSASGRWQEQAIRDMVADAATRLGIEKLVWIE